MCLCFALQGQPSFLEYFELTSRSNGAALISTINGVYQTGGFIGTITQPWIIDKYGRKWACAVVSLQSDP